MDMTAVQKAYARWAPHYDLSFGVVSDIGRRRAVEHINSLLPGTRVLETGVGTGLALPMYAGHLQVTGVDISPDMLERARERSKHAAARVELIPCDAGAMPFEDNTFDVATAMYIMSVVPDPQAVLREMWRTLKPGGEIVIVNHFASTGSVLSLLEAVTAPVCRFIGWHSRFPVETVLEGVPVRPEADIKLPPLGMFRMLRFRKPENGKAQAEIAEALPLPLPEYA